MKHYIIGYDPGGNGKHGVAVLEVEKEKGTERPWRVVPSSKARIECGSTAGEVMEVIEGIMGRDNRIAAAGIDTLTVLSPGMSGWRPADQKLREKYPEIINSVVNPNGMYGAMCLNGLIILEWLIRRPEGESMLITEAHPKVCFYALWNKDARGKERRRHPWAKPDPNGLRIEPADKTEAEQWLLKQFGIEEDPGLAKAKDDHLFDALLGALAGLRGLSGQWTEDLHKEEEGNETLVKPWARKTSYFWPESVA